MSLFVVTSGGSMTNLNERRTPSRNGTLTGTTHRVGTILISLERRQVPLTNGAEFWHRIGTNRWVNETAGSPSTGGVVYNMVPTTKLNSPQRLTVAPNGMLKAVNVRRGPGTSFDVARHASIGSTVTTTHRSDAPNTLNHNLFPPNTSRWVRVGEREWMHRDLLR